ncbi:MAG: hypothetical protein AAB372_00720 [Patescibacteria group bacterium]
MPDDKIVFDLFIKFSKFTQSVYVKRVSASIVTIYYYTVTIDAKTQPPTYARTKPKMAS